MQAAGAIAELARQHATDAKFKSPYTQEALKQGYDVPFWEKVLTATFEDGKLELGSLKVSIFSMQRPWQPRLCLACCCYDRARGDTLTARCKVGAQHGGGACWPYPSSDPMHD